MPETTYCARHLNTQTNLRCGRCDKPVCPQCMVHGPVGVRCPECANLRRLPTFEVSRLQLGRAIAVTLALGIAGGVVFAFFVLLIELPFLLYLLAFVGVGYLVGEGTSLTVNRKRGRALRFVAAGGTLAALLVTALFGVAGPLFFTSLFGIAALVAAFYVAVSRF